MLFLRVPKIAGNGRKYVKDFLNTKCISTVHYYFWGFVSDIPNYV